MAGHGFDVSLGSMARRMEMSKNPLKPGAKAPASGQYEIVGPRGGGTGKERTVVRGETLPPTPKAGQGYKIADRTKNQAGRGK